MHWDHRLVYMLIYIYIYIDRKKERKKKINEREWKYVYVYMEGLQQSVTKKNQIEKNIWNTFCKGSIFSLDVYQGGELWVWYWRSIHILLLLIYVTSVESPYLTGAIMAQTGGDTIGLGMWLITLITLKQGLTFRSHIIDSIGIEHLE